MSECAVAEYLLWRSRAAGHVASTVRQSPRPPACMILPNLDLDPHVAYGSMLLAKLVIVFYVISSTVCIISSISMIFAFKTDFENVWCEVMVYQLKKQGCRTLNLGLGDTFRTN